MNTKAFSNVVKCKGIVTGTDDLLKLLGELKDSTGFHERWYATESQK